MPDSSDNSKTRVSAMAPDASTSPVDWSRPIEAVHEDGRVVRAFLAHLGGDDIARVLWHPEDRNPHEGTFNAFGDALASWPWHIRNVQPTTPEHDPALWDRMVTLVRRIGKGFYMHGANDVGISSYEAVALAEGIVRDLPKPVDPDEQYAADLIRAQGWQGEGPIGEAAVLSMVAKAHRDGRQLAAPEVSHVG